MGLIVNGIVALLLLAAVAAVVGILVLIRSFARRRSATGTVAPSEPSAPVGRQQAPRVAATPPGAIHPEPQPTRAQPNAPEPADETTFSETTEVQALITPSPSQQTASSADDAGALARAIAKCEAGGDKAELASLYIQQAVSYINAGRKDDGASRLRDAIRVAALNRLVAPHALARVELGDLYFSNGDPITACEQWQIARNLFHDLSRPTDRDAVDKRMLSNGCPSDWVLTDF